MHTLLRDTRRWSSNMPSVVVGALPSITAMHSQPDDAGERLSVAAALPPLSLEENRALRSRHLASSLKTHYSQSPAGPLHLVRGQGTYLYDADGIKYLDCVNNVCHVGHCHPRVVRAAAAQLATLNTNTRYLHDNVVRLAERVASTMPAPLEVVMFVNSGSEANDFALRLARAHTGRRDVYCVQGAYHGNSAATLAISPYNKYAPVEAPQGTVTLTCPDAYRLGLTPAETTDRCVGEFKGLLMSCEEGPAAFIVESLICCGGQVVLPPEYLQRMHALARQHGALAISDEVQAGFGRVGEHMWAFQSGGEQVVPDIVTIGKPFGNGFPLAAVVTTREVAASLQEVEYFNTFGGNPVACAVGLEVMSVLEEEGLQHKALDAGTHTLKLLQGLAHSHPAIGDVRGTGLLLGIEFVRDRATREPDATAVEYVMLWMRAHRHVLVSTDGPFGSVIKIKPPMTFSRRDGETLAEAVGAALASYEAGTPL